MFLKFFQEFYIHTNVKDEIENLYNENLNVINENIQENEALKT